MRYAVADITALISKLSNWGIFSFNVKKTGNPVLLWSFCLHGGSETCSGLCGNKIFFKHHLSSLFFRNFVTYENNDWFLLIITFIEEIYLNVACFTFLNLQLFLSPAHWIGYTKTSKFHKISLNLNRINALYLVVFFLVMSHYMTRSQI